MSIFTKDEALDLIEIYIESNKITNNKTDLLDEKIATQDDINSFFM